MYSVNEYLFILNYIENMKHYNRSILVIWCIAIGSIFTFTLSHASAEEEFLRQYKELEDWWDSLPGPDHEISPQSAPDPIPKIYEPTDTIPTDETAKGKAVHAVKLLHRSYDKMFKALFSAMKDTPREIHVQFRQRLFTLEKELEHVEHLANQIDGSEYSFLEYQAAFWEYYKNAYKYDADFMSQIMTGTY